MTYLVASLVVLCVGLGFVVGRIIQLWGQTLDTLDDAIETLKFEVSDKASLQSQLAATTNRNGDLQALVAKLEEELANAGIKPAAVREAEGDLIGAYTGNTPARRLSHRHARSHHRAECQCDDCSYRDDETND